MGLTNTSISKIFWVYPKTIKNFFKIKLYFFRKIMKKKIISSKKLYLMYTNLPLKISNKTLIDLIQNKIRIKNFILGSNEKNETKTVHIFIENNYLIRKHLHFFDLILDDILYKANFVSATRKKDIIKNICSKKDVLTNLKNTENGKIIFDSNKYLLDLAKKLKPAEIEKVLIEEFPDLYLKKGASISNTLKKISEHHTQKQNKIEIKSSLDKFNQKNIPKEIFDWKENNQNKSLIIHGEVELIKLNLF